jgi:hypothetical protein
MAMEDGILKLIIDQFRRRIIITLDLLTDYFFLLVYFIVGGTCCGRPCLSTGLQLLERLLSRL